MKTVWAIVALSATLAAPTVASIPQTGSDKKVIEPAPFDIAMAPGGADIGGKPRTAGGDARSADKLPGAEEPDCIGISTGRTGCPPGSSDACAGQAIPAK